MPGSNFGGGQDGGRLIFNFSIRNAHFGYSNLCIICFVSSHRSLTISFQAEEMEAEEMEEEETEVEETEEEMVAISVVDKTEVC